MKRMNLNRNAIGRMFGVDLLSDPVSPVLAVPTHSRPAPAPIAPPPPKTTAESEAAGVELSATVARLDVALAKLQAMAATASPVLAAELKRAATHLARASRILRSPTFRPRPHRRFAGLRPAAA
jgi:hypothetical protein